MVFASLWILHFLSSYEINSIKAPAPLVLIEWIFFFFVGEVIIVVYFSDFIFVSADILNMGIGNEVNKLI